jgi:hypothetical protein
MVLLISVRTERMKIKLYHLLRLLCLFAGCAGAIGMPLSERPMKVVLYSDFGAVGDGKTDDLDAIVRAHDYANSHGFLVKANEDARYYIGGRDKSAIIQTDTDFGSAEFIIDDTAVENRRTAVFIVQSAAPTFKLKGVTSLKKGQTKLDITLPDPCVVRVENSELKHYIRYGNNQNKGKAQTDIFIVDKNGNVDACCPIIWDFDQITNITASPIDAKRLTIRGGHFTTHANTAESRYTYYQRGINIRRSNVTIDGLKHYITGEGDHGAPYSGFISIQQCANVTVQNCVLSGHKTYQTIGSAGKPVSMGSYDISVNRAINIAFVNCTQSNDIKDRKYWGIMASNYSKNLSYDQCTLSRFDAHMGVTNASIRNSEIGHAGINAIGHGTFTIENTTVYGYNLINLRSDYGSTWDGEWIIRNSIFVPFGSKWGKVALIGGSNSGQHDFGYPCRMPERIRIDTLYIDDSHSPNDYAGPAIFANFNKDFTNEHYVEKYPYIKTQELSLKDVTSASGKPLVMSDNPFMFRGIIWHEASTATDAASRANFE